MRSRTRRIVALVSMVLGGAYLSTATGCMNYIAETAATSADFSFIFNCDAAVGGTFQLDAFLLDCQNRQ